jgi:DNA-binding GntR family transcriptional regulator
MTDAEIYDGLVAAVHDHRLLPGTKLVEEKLGTVYGVSRTRIRQVLIRLAHEQIVTLAPNRGATIAQPSVEESREVFEVRRLIEPTLLKLCVTRADDAQLAALERHIDDEERARQQGNRPLALTLSGSFHVRIAETSGHATLTRLLQEMVSRTSLVLMTYGDIPPAPRRPAQWADACSCKEHRSLFAALRARDAEAATSVMLDHLQQIEAALCFNLPEPRELDLLDLLRPEAASPTTSDT